MKKRFFSIMCMMVVSALIGASNVSAADINVPVGDPIQQYIDTAAAGDVLILAAGEYTVQAPPLVVSKSITIRGQGKNVTYVQANAQPFQQKGRVFQIESTATNVIIESMTIRNGDALDGSDGNGAGMPGEDGENGGGILNNGGLTIISCKLTNNRAGAGGDGKDGATGASGTVSNSGNKQGCSVSTLSAHSRRYVKQV